MKAKRTKVIGEVGVATYCGPCVRRLNRGLATNGAPEVEVRPCARGEHFPCFGCGHLFDGTAIDRGDK